MPADYTNLPANIATRVAVAADAYYYERTYENGVRLRDALAEAREAERVTVEKCWTAAAGAKVPEHLNDKTVPQGVVIDVLRAAGYTVGE